MIQARPLQGRHCAYALLDIWRCAVRHSIKELCFGAAGNYSVHVALAAFCFKAKAYQVGHSKQLAVA